MLKSICNPGRATTTLLPVAFLMRSTNLRSSLLPSERWMSRMSLAALKSCRFIVRTALVMLMWLSWRRFLNDGGMLPFSMFRFNIRSS